MCVKMQPDPARPNTAMRPALHDTLVARTVCHRWQLTHVCPTWPLINSRLVLWQQPETTLPHAALAAQQGTAETCRQHISKCMKYVRYWGEEEVVSCTGHDAQSAALSPYALARHV
jgi:hypothetical protein